MTKLLFGLSELNALLSKGGYSKERLFVVADANTAGHCLAMACQQVPRLRQAMVLETPAGEEAKTLATAQALWNTLLRHGADKRSLLLNLGGGSVSDVGGFVAACYKRGVRYVNVPTTLLSMADAAIGGKTALNLGGVKNVVGLVCQPQAVCLDSVFLPSLPAEELRNGLFEVLKTLMLCDAPLYHALRAAMGEGGIPPEETLRTMIARCASFKAAVAHRDPRDRGVRHMLNLGHTFGHAMEAYGHLPHGMAVGVGLACALYLSERKMGMPQGALHDYMRMLRAQVAMPQYTLRDTEPLLRLMRQDKKNADGDIRCVLLQDWETPVINVGIEDNEVRDTLLRVCPCQR